MRASRITRDPGKRCSSRIFRSPQRARYRTPCGSLHIEDVSKGVITVGGPGAATRAWLPDGTNSRLVVSVFKPKVRLNLESDARHLA